LFTCHNMAQVWRLDLSSH